MTNWKPVTFQAFKWESHYSESMLSRRDRESIVASYHAAVPNIISTREIRVSKQTQNLLDDALLIIGRFDMFISQKDYNLPSLLLRSESSSSSQIEQLTASTRNIALAEISPKAPENSRMIAGNIMAMKKALDISGSLSIETIEEIHRALLEGSNTRIAGKLRTQQVWIGGSSFGPGGADFVPPHHTRIKEFLYDLISFSKRTDLNYISKAAILHAQFETIHPFEDGNGRTGRTLIHSSLLQDRALLHSALPLSAGLLNNVDNYYNALSSYQNGDISPIINEVASALIYGAQLGTLMSEKVDEIIEQWKHAIDARVDSSLWRLINLIVEQPVVDAKFVYRNLNISERSAGIIIAKAVDFGVLTKIGNTHKGIFYEAKDITKLLDIVCSAKPFQRLFPR